jgi:hypothetical protein
MKKHFLVLLALAVGVGAEPSLNDNLDAQVVVARHDKAVLASFKIINAERIGG